MRVLFVSQELPPETGWGGIGTYVDVLSEALGAAGAEVHVLSVVPDQPESTREIGGVTVYRRPLRAPELARLRVPDTWRRVWLPFDVARWVRQLGLRPDVIEAPEWMAEGLALSLRGEFPLVVRLHSSARQLFPHTGQGQALRGVDGRVASWLEEASARRANVVVSTRSNLDEVADGMGLHPGALHAIPYPVRLPELSAMPNHASPRVTFVGRLEPRKGPELVLRSVPAVLKEIPDAKFVFVGRDACSADLPSSSAGLLREAKRLGVEGAIELTGQLEPAAVIDRLHAATVGVFPSRWESFGNVVAEASAVGRPVVASTIPPFRELVEHGVTGYLVGSEDAAAWARSLIDVLSDRQRAGTMGRAGAERVAGISAPKRVAGLALAAYEDAIGRWHRGERAGR